MGLQCLDSNTDLLDMSVSPLKESRSRYFYGSSWHNPMIGSSESSLMRDAIMSVEEMKIRGELEVDIERDLEEEIKDGIYHLALRLHRLYQHQKERNAREFLLHDESGEKGKILSEVNIIIRMDGGTKIEIKETKKEAPERSRTRASAAQVTRGMPLPADTKKFDWAKSLRQTGASPRIATNKKISNSSYQARMSYDRNLKLENAKRNKGNGSGDHNLLQLGWRI
eukprot:XP_010646330.1 PREDICTED: uncharacterized protein LOC104878165 [Vitis vinifera]